MSTPAFIASRRAALPIAVAIAVSVAFPLILLRAGEPQVRPFAAPPATKAQLVFVSPAPAKAHARALPGSVGSPVATPSGLVASLAAPPSSGGSVVSRILPTKEPATKPNHASSGAHPKPVPAPAQPTPPPAQPVVPTQPVTPTPPVAQPPVAKPAKPAKAEKVGKAAKPTRTDKREMAAHKRHGNGSRPDEHASARAMARASGSAQATPTKPDKGNHGNHGDRATRQKPAKPDKPAKEDGPGKAKGEKHTSSTAAPQPADAQPAAQPAPAAPATPAAPAVGQPGAPPGQNPNPGQSDHANNGHGSDHQGDAGKGPGKSQKP